MIAILIKAAVSVAVIFFAYKVGRCSAIKEIYDYKYSRINTISKDLLSFAKDFDK